MSELPESGMVYNMRVWEMQCANLNGKTAEEWYWMPVAERTWKVAAMIIPNVSTLLEGIQMKANAKRRS